MDDKELKIEMEELVRITLHTKLAKQNQKLMNLRKLRPVK